MKAVAPFPLPKQCLHNFEASLFKQFYFGFFLLLLIKSRSDVQSFCALIRRRLKKAKERINPSPFRPYYDH